MEFIERRLEEPGVPEECFERTGLKTKTTMIVGGEVVSGFARNAERVQELVKELKQSTVDG
ncbi:MAG: hypothetical protein IBX61_04645 [Thermoleophilia bacterium]|nr:hypothetical protein [Thermoleophilia bacterium]